MLIAGDGGFQSNIQELQTIVHHRLPVKMVVLNNGCHGMVRQFQESYFEGRYQSTLWGYSAPDFARGRSRLRNSLADSRRAPRERKRLCAGSGRIRQGPALLQVMIDTYANAYPKIAFGSPMTEMEPSS